MKIKGVSLGINLGLLIAGLLTVFTGFLVQIEYHLGSHTINSANKYVYGFSYNNWSDTHKVAIVIMSICMLFHIYLHWKWYSTVLKKRLFAKNKQVLTLTIVFLLVAITGFLPWIIDLFEGSHLCRKGFIEVHDKIAIILSIYLILHLVKRMKWFVSTFKKLNTK